jgi:hypothetical protein
MATVREIVVREATTRKGRQELLDALSPGENTGSMPYFLVPIRGNPDQAAGLLAKAGIQNVVSLADSAGFEVPAGNVPARRVAARLSAESAKLAAERVRRALEGEPFTVGVARPEPGSE